MIAVGINGYGTIGKRVADAVDRQPDMRVTGVTKTQATHEAWTAKERSFPLHAPSDSARTALEEAGLPVAGSIDDLVTASDVMVDATPSGIGAEYEGLYADHGTPAIFQGGEAPDIAPVSFNSQVSYDETRRAGRTRVLSCNGTGLCRVIATLDRRFGVESAQATIVRRGGDPDQPDRGPINDIVPDPISVPSHHGTDLERVFPEIPVTTMALTVPTTLMHVHTVSLELETDPTAAAARRTLAEQSRCSVLESEYGPTSCGSLLEFVRDRRPRGDLWENAIWGESVTVRDGTVSLIQAIHQESDVIPETIDAVRALDGSVDAETSRARTDVSLGLGFETPRRESATPEPG